MLSGKAKDDLDDVKEIIVRRIGDISSEGKVQGLQEQAAIT